jgi:hypothetical protein
MKWGREGHNSRLLEQLLFAPHFDPKTPNLYTVCQRWHLFNGTADSAGTLQTTAI